MRRIKKWEISIGRVHKDPPIVKEDNITFSVRREK